MNKVIKGLDIGLIIVFVFQAIDYFVLYTTKAPIDRYEYVILGIAFLTIAFHRVLDHKSLNKLEKLQEILNEQNK